jgi:glucan-binding YG repeat protein
MLSAAETFAADHVISSLTIRVVSDLEPGDTLPGIDTGSTSASDGGISVYVSGSKCQISDAEWVTSTKKDMSVGSTPEMKITLVPEDDYYFKGSYRSSNITVKGGTFVSADRRSSEKLVVKLKVKAISGDFDPPEDAYWKDNTKGTAKWEAPDSNDTGKYEVQLKKGSSTVTTIETTSKTYNFYPYMTTAGTYKFKVRTIARTSSQENYGKKSSWTESDEIYIAKEDVSDGRGQEGTISTVQGITTSTGQAGWIQSSGNWYYRYPNGEYASNTWQKINDNWYLFDADGRMLTGWQLYNGRNYLLGSDGVMLTGWQYVNNNWYYLNPYPDSYEGTLFVDMMYTIDGNTYYFQSDGTRAAGWNSVNGNWYYFYPDSGIMARNTTIDTFYVNENGEWVR